MKKAFTFKDEKSDKFWNIDYSGCDFCVNYGKAGTIGKYEIKEWDDAETCVKEAEKLIRSKLKKGYTETAFDYENHFYFDDEEIGLHPETSHPNFVSHFTNELYYDCADEEAPFGSDEGSDALSEIEERLRKKPDFPFVDFPKFIIENPWGMDYIPVDSLDESEVKTLIEKDEMNVTQSDMVTYAVAFAQIKITGKLDPQLKQMALDAMNRMEITSRLLGWQTGLSEVTQIMIKDLTEFKAEGNK